MGNFCSFLKKKISDDPTIINNSPFLKNMHYEKNNDAKIDIDVDVEEDDNKDLPSYSQV